MPAYSVLVVCGEGGLPVTHRILNRTVTKVSVMVDNNRITKLISMSMDDELPQESQRELEQQLARDKRTRRIREVMLATREIFGRRQSSIFQVELPAEAKLRIEHRLRAAFIESDST